MNTDNYSNYPEYDNREEFEFACPRCGEMRPDDNDLCSECRAEDVEIAREAWGERWEQAN